jgi:ligand-binding SRPBCC domain-containing protein
MIVERESIIDTPVDRVWARVVSPEGINDEMRPWMTMSVPRGAESMTIDNIPVGKPIGRAWLRLFGIVPFDYDFLAIAELDPGRRFHEKSTMLSMRRWEHERTLTPRDDGRTGLHDRVTFEPRTPMSLMAPLIGRVLYAFFGHRHRRLQSYFG